jgi:hypothetical protein
MRNPFGLIAPLTTLLATGLSAQESKQPALADDVPKVTCVADEGFLLEHGGKPTQRCWSQETIEARRRL